jgi:hypothetical protein
MARVPYSFLPLIPANDLLEFRAVVIAVEHSWGLDRELIAAETKNIN